MSAISSFMQCIYKKEKLKSLFFYYYFIFHECISHAFHDDTKINTTVMLMMTLNAEHTHTQRCNMIKKTMNIMNSYFLESIKEKKLFFFNMKKRYDIMNSFYGLTVV